MGGERNAEGKERREGGEGERKNRGRGGLRRGEECTKERQEGEGRVFFFYFTRRDLVIGEIRFGVFTRAGQGGRAIPFVSRYKIPRGGRIFATE